MTSPIRSGLPVPRAASRIAWPALVVALAFGAVEWLALARSRGADRLDALRRGVTRR